LNGTVTNLGLLPFAFTDFAFAAFAEQFGFIGNLLLISLYLGLFTRILFIASETKNKFGFLMTIGVLVMISLNTFQHIGMNMGLLPITGVPLPLISYGGSSMLVIFIGLGLIQSVRVMTENEEKDIINLKTKFIHN
jgi:rod shape determining protein RodA